MIDLIYLTYNRLEFTQKSLATLAANTNWDLVRNMWIYDDASRDGTLEFVRSFDLPKRIISAKLRSPVAVMNDFLTSKAPAPLFAKIDNDVMVPPGWLDVCLGLMGDLDLLGIEAMYPVSPDAPRQAVAADFIGGIGLMRTAAFQTLPEAYGRFGFTAWQDQHPEVRKAWINPSLPVCLLDRMTSEPWRSLSQGYVAKGWQRPWAPYGAESAALWKWWN